MQLQILHAFDVGFQPLRDVGVLGHLHGRRGIARLNFTKTALIDLGQQRLH